MNDPGHAGFLFCLLEECENAPNPETQLSKSSLYNIA